MGGGLQPRQAFEELQTRSQVQDCNIQSGQDGSETVDRHQTTQANTVRTLSLQFVVQIITFASVIEYASLLALRVYPVRFGVHTAQHLPQLITNGAGKPIVADEVCGPQIFASMQWQDWPEANLRDVGVYLRGGTGGLFSPHTGSCV